MTDFEREQLLLKFRDNQQVIGLIALENPKQLPALTDGYDILLLIVTKDLTLNNHIYHYMKCNVRIQERWMDPSSLEHWIRYGHNRNIIHWLFKGEILLDQHTYLEGLRHQTLEFSPHMRDQKLLLEFSSFLSKYLQSKEYLLDDHLLDAYNHILESLRHWARIVVIEEGYHPEVTVWRQIRTINAGVYKLYEELTMSKETLKQRVQLVLLACEFSVMSKMERCCKLLIKILNDREHPWGVDELRIHPELADMELELPLLLNKLTKKSLIKEIAVPKDEELSELELKYTSAS